MTRKNREKTVKRILEIKEVDGCIHLRKECNGKSWLDSTGTLLT